MKFQPGDRVRFLNEVGGGVVTRIRSPKMVDVKNSDGFEVPTLITELVKIDGEGYVNDIFTHEVEKKAPIEPVVVKVEEQHNQRFTKVVKDNSQEKIPLGVYLAWMPHNTKFPLLGSLDLFLINDTGFTVLYNLMMKEDDGTFSGTDYDTIPPHSQLLIEVVEREDIDQWNAGVIQLLFHETSSHSVMRPISTAFDIKPVRFFKEDNYRMYALLPSRAFLFTVCKIVEIVPLHHSNRALKDRSDDIEFSRVSAVQAAAFIDKYAISATEAEVDLHIEKLTNRFKTLQPHEMLEIQTNIFIKALESAINKRFDKVVFIHGVGKGKLKQRLVELLEEYTSVTYRDASIRKYGVGAIEIKILNH